MSPTIARAVLFAVLATILTAQAAEPAPAQLCEYWGADFLSSGEKQHGYSVDELARNLPKLLDACAKAVEADPKSARLHARDARVLAVAGDTAGALREARLGAELGSSMAMVQLAVMHADGNGVARDYGAALKLLRDAAKKDHPLAFFNLAVMQANGWGAPADDADAIAQFHRAAAGLDPLAMQILADAYAKGRGVTADPAAVERWLTKAGERSPVLPEGRRNPLRIATLGRVQPDTAALLAWYERRARAGDLWAQTYVGRLYEAGQWVTQDYAAAQTWYRRAADSGSVHAQMSMAALYSNGLGVERDEKEARRWTFMYVNQACDRAAQAEPGANACDRFAADAQDPAKVVPGFSAFCMNRYAERAVPACQQALAQSPSTLRYRAQLARALAHVGRFDDARREALDASAKGSTLAMTLLGAMNEYGYGAPKDEPQALAWYRKAAELDDDRAIALVSMRVMGGMGIAKDSPEAKALSKEMSERQWKRYTAKAAPAADTQAVLAEKGDAKAQHNLAYEFEQQKKYDEAVRWYTRAAEQGYGLSQMNLAQMYEKGFGVKQDFAAAKKWYRKGMEVGSGESLYRLASLNDKTGDYQEAIKLYRRGVKQDDYRAMVDLGDMLEQGRGVEKDVAQAAQLYEQAADRSKWAQFKLGIMSWQGSGVPKSEAKALQWWQKAADGGNGKAQNNLGVMYDRGIAVSRDYKKALDWYLRAQARGGPQAKGNLEDFFEEGRGAPADGPAAVAWYRAGAEAEAASAQYKLGVIYAKGRGVARNEMEAVTWLTRALDQGYAKAAPELGEVYFTLGQRLENEAGEQNRQTAQQYYSQAGMLGNKRAVEQLVKLQERSGHGNDTAKLREFFAQVPPIREAPKFPVGFNLDPGKDEQREMQIRSAGTGVAASNAQSADAWEVIFWAPPQPKRTGQ